MAQTIWTEAGPILTSERTPPEWVEQAEASAAVSVADPLPLGLAAFAVTIFLLGAIYAFFASPGPASRLMMPVAFWFGGIIQLLAAMWAIRKGNTYGATAMGTLSGFWLTWAGLQYLGAAGVGTRMVESLYFALFGVVTLYLFFTAFQVSAAMIVMMLASTCFFWSAAWGIGLNAMAGFRVAGWCGMVTGAVAFYTSLALVVDSVAHRELVPVCFLGPLARGMRPAGGREIPITS